MCGVKKSFRQFAGRGKADALGTKKNSNEKKGF